MAKESRFTTAEEIFHRIRWDDRLNMAAFVIGYADRMARSGIREKSLADWGADSDIPWHRVRYYRCGETMVWNREARLDRFSDDNLPHEAWAASVSEMRQPGLQEIPVLKWNGESWDLPDVSEKSGSTESLRVLSFNVLTDQFGEDYVRTTERLPALLSELRNHPADVLMLQEMFPALHAQLLREPWCRESYFISELELEEGVHSHGLMILSRFPFRCHSFPLAPNKRAFIAATDINGEKLHFINVHLSSNRTPGADALRTAQITDVLNRTAGLSGPVLIGGDFNSREDNLFTMAAEAGFTDAWLQMYPHEEGITFDPGKNPLAAEGTISGLPGRLDRILYKTSGWEVEQATLFADEVIAGSEEGIFASDHFGIMIRFSLSPVKNQFPGYHPSHHTALCLIPEEADIAFIQDIRRQYDKQFHRWMPHINLLYGFVPPALLAPAADRISPALLSFDPFILTFSHFACFQHRDSVTVYAAPDAQSQEKIKQLQSALFFLFPDCDEQSRKENGYTPHLTVGQFSSQEEAQQLLSRKVNFHFEVNSVQLISRESTTPFQKRFAVQLRSGKVRQSPDAFLQFALNADPPADEAHAAQKQATRSALENFCTAVTGEPPLTYEFGSAALGVETRSSDLDLAVALPPGWNVHSFSAQLAAKLREAGVEVRFVSEGREPLVRLAWHGFGCDVQPFIHPQYGGELHTGLRGMMDEMSWKTASAVLEPQEIMRAATAHLTADAFRGLARMVKAWAKARQIIGSPWGYPGSFAWTLLAAASVQAQDAPEAGSELQTWFAWFLKWLQRLREGSQVSVSGAKYRPGSETVPAVLPVVRPLPPHGNAARNLTRGTWTIIQQEAEIASKKLSSGQAESIWEKWTPESPLRIQISGTGNPGFYTIKGWLEGQFLSWQLYAEREGISARPLAPVQGESFFEAGWDISFKGEFSQGLTQVIQADLNLLPSEKQRFIHIMLPSN